MFNKKCTKLVAAMGITLFAGTAQAVVQNIAVNGDFETGDFTGWAQFPGSLGAAGQTIVAGNPGFAASLMSQILLPISSSRQISCLAHGLVVKQ